ncbi:MAG: hypothetical protein FH759_12355 [Sediminimonas qiaohouensis]|uniref:Uncharacterized protein n=1 Tax=Sediminimonas qiaohouensis TaxID=552061 RepID=A0A7C9HBU6_9RHOB|nr:hypothetical protein [Sediminimonas qiaohouensis]MTJ05470.1 hypothetical protein [Sediminimonas qiaohouensis]
MSTFLSREVQQGLEEARKRELKRSSRLRIMVDDQTWPVLRLWDDGFALEVEEAPHLRGLVDLYDGARHLSQCLIIASAEEGGEMHYEFKRITAAHDSAPLDFARDEDAPVALIGP